MFCKSKRSRFLAGHLFCIDATPPLSRARFENEKFVELINRTVHAATLSVLVETANSYRFYFAVYVRSVGR
jgi:hypothetical protein